MKSLFYLIVVFLGGLVACTSSESEPIKPPSEQTMNEEEEEEEEVEETFKPIDLSNWKVTLPIGNPTEVEPPEILDYPNIDILKEFMFDDTSDSSLVFYTYPGSTTANSSYSRTELREQLVPGSNNTNWTFSQGGNMRGTLKLDEISKKSNGDFHRTMVMQIHGRLTNAQRDEVGEDDNNAPPILKVYWDKGRIRVIRKTLKDIDVPYPDILLKDAWTDEGVWFTQTVDNDLFTLEIDVKDSVMKVILNNDEEVVFDDIHTERWGIFENYFKAGNYLQTTDSGSFARVKYYDLHVIH